MLRYLFNHGLFLAIIFIAASNISGQAVIIQQDRPIRSDSLTAIVMHQGDEPIVGASVEWLQPKWGKIRKVITTNINGYFSFGVSRPGIYWIRLHAAGFQQHLIKIRVSKRTKTWPKLVMEIAT